MGSGDCDEGLISGNSEAQCLETTVEIKIKTLDSNTYTLRVDKCVPVPRLKEEVAIVTGVVSDQQRLICRGRVLKDDQLLSAYHVEDGHTLHLVVRQPIPSASQSFADHPATSPVSTNGYSQSLPTMVDVSDQDVGFLPDLTQIFSSFLNSFGMTIIGNDSSLEGLSRGNGSSDFRDSRRQQSELGAVTVQSSSQNNNSSSLPSAVSSVPLQPPVLPDSLTTLTEYLSHLRQEFSSIVRGQRSSDSAGSNASGEPHSNTAGPNGLPNPVSLAAVIQSTRQLLVEQVAEFLLTLRRQMEDQGNGTGSLAQMSIQSNAHRSGLLLHQVGALLLELGRAIMTLRMGQTAADVVVNAGPALFISSSGPNPITVQLDHIQQRRNFGATLVGFGFPARNLDARMRIGSVLPTGAPESPAQMDSVVSGGASSTATARVSANPLHRESEIRPVRTVRVIRALPAQIRRPSNLSRNSAGNLNGSRRSPSPNENNIIESRRQTSPGYAEQRQSNVSSGPNGDGGSEGLPNGQHIFAENLARSTTSPHAQTSEMSSNTQETDNSFGDGTFLSNLLHQVMPLISQNTASRLTATHADSADVSYAGIQNASSIQAEEHSTTGASSRRRPTPPPSPNSKRQKKVRNWLLYPILGMVVTLLYE